jgi:hypothetical protein
MLYYLSAVERNFYRRTLRACLFLLIVGLLLGFAGGYGYKAIDTKYGHDRNEHEKIRGELKEQRGRIVGLEGAWGIRQKKEKPKLHGEGEKGK